jgi:hypothetical protein
LAELEERVAEVNDGDVEIRLELERPPVLGQGVFVSTGRHVGQSQTVNADGRQDLALANSTLNALSVLPGTGYGGFGTATSFTGQSSAAVAIGNVNNDRVVVDQTILTGPQAPNFATKTICASVLSFSPFILAEAVDEIPPHVTASLERAGKVARNTGPSVCGSARPMPPIRRPSPARSWRCRQEPRGSRSCS